VRGDTVAAPMLQLKRAYDPVSPDDGTRILIDRLWPRGISKEKLKIESWDREVAPSTALREWFGHDPAKWNDFKRRYFAELLRNPSGWRFLLDAARKGRLTLIYSAKDTEHNDAVALKEFLESRLGNKT
jgi:uncharacterized protein YeaO (DUF488 family)